MAMRYPGGFISSTAPTVNANTAKGVWTLEEAMQYIRAGQWPVPTGNGDPYFQYNTMLLPGQGTNGAQNNTFLDSSTNNFTITRNGNTTQGTFTPFSGTAGNWSNFFDGSGDYFTSSTSLFNYTTGNASNETFTIEAYIYHNARSTPSAVQYAQSIAAKGDVYLNFGINGTGNLIFYHYDGSTRSFTGSSVIPLNQWTHVAVRVTGGTATLYVNGVSDGSGTWYGIQAAGLTATSYFGTPALNASALAFNGFTSNLRISNNARTITVPTAPYSNDANTVFLTSQSNRFIDNSSNAYAITPVGGVSVTPFQPFGAPTTAYSASTIGGSGYFDGTGDYLTATANNAFNFGTGDFTVEGWIYPVAAGTMGIWANGPASAGSFGIAINSSGRLQMDYYGGTSLGGATNVPVNAWSYFAFVRTGSTLNIYLNGVRDATTTTSSNNSTNDFALGLGWTNITTGGTNGYISGFRISDAFARYTGTTMTVPTAPTVNDGNTTVLCNFTNAGIIDNAQDNNLETVGGAQISTTQYKWGASSVAFDGTTDYLIPYGSTTNLFAFGSGAFTIEMWFYVTSFPNQYVALYDSRPASTNGFYPVISLENNGSVYFYVNSANAISSGSGVISTGRWYHLAVVKAGSSTKMFVNGNQVGSTYADTNTYLIAANRPVIGASGFTLGNDSLNGYIQDLRVTKGYARYPYNFTAPTAAFPLFWQAAATPSSDPYFDYTTLLLPGNGTNGAQNNTFLDSSTNAFTITRNGNTTQGTFTPFSQTGWGNFFDGTGDYLTAADNAALNFSTGDFTIEGWFYLAGYNGSSFIAKGVGGTSGYGLGISTSGNKYSLFLTSLGEVIVSGSTAVLNTWTHVAVTRSGSTIRLFVNGVVEGTYTSSADLSSTELQKIGISRDGSALFNGYISNVRLVKGTAVYTSAFTVPTSPLTAVSGTSLLTCQSNRFIDNSTNAFTITRNGDTSVQAFSPFNPTAAYSTSTVGGSGYFDGSGDYLSVANNALIATGDFTMEAWCYTTRNNAYQGIISSGDSSNTAGARIVQSNTGNVEFWVNGQANTSTALPINQWNHVAIVRSGSASNNISCYLNGTRLGQLTQTSTTSNNTVVVGRYYNNGTDQYHWLGYIADARFVVGSAVYSGATYTVPTAPLTAVTNTQLLLSGTNGGIIDNTAKNNLETVGGAAISTTVSKFGGSSMYFDGTGDYLISNKASSSLVAYGTGDFTIEFWLYLNTTSGTQLIYDQRKSSASDLAPMLMYYTNAVCYYTNANIQITGSALTVSTWNHIALCRYGGSTRLYINGVQSGSTYSDSNNYVGFADRPVIGAEGVTVGNNPLNGYINDLRLTKGIARYTQNFTPPTTAFLTL